MRRCRHEHRRISFADSAEKGNSTGKAEKNETGESVRGRKTLTQRHTDRKGSQRKDKAGGWKRTTASRSCDRLAASTRAASFGDLSLASSFAKLCGLCAFASKRSLRRRKLNPPSPPPATVTTGTNLLFKRTNGTTAPKRITPTVRFTGRIRCVRQSDGSLFPQASPRHRLLQPDRFTLEGNSQRVDSPRLPLDTPTAPRRPIARNRAGPGRFYESHRLRLGLKPLPRELRPDRRRPPRTLQDIPSSLRYRAPRRSPD